MQCRLFKNVYNAKICGRMWCFDDFVIAGKHKCLSATYTLTILPADSIINFVQYKILHCRILWYIMEIIQDSLNCVINFHMRCCIHRR